MKNSKLKKTLNFMFQMRNMTSISICTCCKDKFHGMEDKNGSI